MALPGIDALLRPHLSLDFAARSPWRRRAPGLILLVAGALALAGILWFDRGQAELLSRQEARLAAFTHQTDPASRALRSRQEATQRATEAALRQLAVPWDQLFAAVESASMTQTALLALKPESRQGTVQISGEARDLDALLSYLAQLETSPGLQSVFLTRHERMLDKPGTPVRFVITARWLSEGQRRPQ